MTEKRIGLMGARSLIGHRLIPLLTKRGYMVYAITRRGTPPEDNVHNAIWHRLGPYLPPAPLWVSMLPIWELPQYFHQLEEAGIRRLIAFSSTSRIVKADSPDERERKLAEQLADAEEKIAAWAGLHDITWTILRPTMIYDEGKDRNISEIARFIRRFGFFPIVGHGTGLRMPVTASDLASAVINILDREQLRQNYYNLSGKDALSYNDMVVRIFKALGKKPRIVRLPYPLFATAIRIARIVPKMRHLTLGLAKRMQKDQAFPHDDAVKDFAYNPRAFHPVFK